MTSDIEKSLKSRINNISIEKNIASIALWQNLVLERFLIRIIHSKYVDHFVLKGGMLLSKLIDIQRETKDLDFAIQGLSNSLDEIQKVIQEIIQIKIDDGFSFKNLNIKKLLHPSMHYVGARINMDAYFGRIRFKVLIDLGFGDYIEPYENILSLTTNKNNALFESSIKLKCYPIDFIFAEKLQSIIDRKKMNSRMKDYHDLFLLTSQKDRKFSKQFLIILKKVFQHRNTELNLPIQFNDDGDCQRTCRLNYFF
jgi:predicted nucleotidyltransferase component of viral defense system